MHKSFEEIHEIYCKRYPHLKHIQYGNWEKGFADNALRLACPDGITMWDIDYLAKISVMRIKLYPERLKKEREARRQTVRVKSSDDFMAKLP